MSDDQTIDLKTPLSRTKWRCANCGHTPYVWEPTCSDCRLTPAQGEAKAAARERKEKGLPEPTPPGRLFG